jgi:flagellin
MAQADYTRIATNIGALNALQSLRTINNELGIHQQRLSTGKRINSAADDPAGLTIATKFLSRSEGMKVAMDNIGDAKNLLSVAESGVSRINDILVQMRNKVLSAASDTLGTEERSAIQTQLENYAAQIDDIVEQTEWNNNKLIDGTYLNTALSFQTGVDSTDTTTLSGLVDLSATGATGLSLATSGATGGSAAAASEVNDASDILSDGTVASADPAGNALAPELASGTYTIEITYGADSGAASSIILKDADGVAQTIDADSTSGGAVSTSGVLSATEMSAAGGTVTYDFGNGLTVDLNTVDWAGGDDPSGTTLAATVSYTQSVAASSAHQIASLSAGTADVYRTYLGTIETAMTTVSEQMSKLGALQGRLTFKEEQVSVAQINVEASYNRIMNADMAFEQLEATKMSILQQTSMTMLAQANLAPQSVLSLFQ